MALWYFPFTYCQRSTTNPGIECASVCFQYRIERAESQHKTLLSKDPEEAWFKKKKIEETNPEKAYRSSDGRLPVKH